MKRHLLSGVGASFVEPLCPKRGQVVTIRCRVLSNDVNWVRLAEISDYSPDIMLRHEMKREGDVFSVDMRMDEPVLRYWLEANVSGMGSLYLSKRGESHVCPCNRDTFEIIADLDVPSWIPNAVCYQIFPDRFAKGDPSVGAKAGGYVFDGHEPVVMDWNDEPLQYKDGHCLDFFNGDLKGIADKVEHFKELGVTTLYLNPIGCSMTTHRYDCTDYFHVDPKLGGDDAYASMIQTMHENGIKVVTDISINHTGIEHPWFKNALNGGEEKEFYYEDGKGDFDYWFGVRTLPQLNYKSKRLRDLVFAGEGSVLKKFLRPPFCQDGWRMDVATCVGVNGSDRMCHEIWQNVRKSVKAVNPQAYIVGECWEDAGSFLQGDQWDATMNYVGCSRPLRSWMGEEDRYFCRNMNDPGVCRPFTAKELRDNLFNQLSSLPSQMVYQQMNLIDSHDIPRLYNHRQVFDRDLYFGAVMMLFMLPGMPSIYYGDEIALSGPMGTAENCRYPMQWDRSKWNMSFYDLYCSLGRLRASYGDALGTGLWEFGYCDDDVLEFTRTSGLGVGQQVKLVMFRGDSKRIVSDIGISGYADWFTGEVFSTGDSLVLLPKQSRVLVKG